MKQRADLIVTSDFHIDFIDSPIILDEFIAAISERRPRLFIAAGDLGHGKNFEKALAVLNSVKADRKAVLVGNHDLWSRRFWPRGITTDQLYREILPNVAKEYGWIWLEHETLRIDDVAVIGSVAWYDYSACPRPHETPDTIRKIKAGYNNDGSYLSDEWDDLAIAEECRAGLVQLLDAVEKNPTIKRAVVVTHVPILKEQQVLLASDERMGDSYFYNLTIGKDLLRYSKLVEVVSGHTHRGVDCLVERPGMPSVRARVIGADYGAPAFVEVSL